jgi:cytochrome c553
MSNPMSGSLRILKESSHGVDMVSPFSLLARVIACCACLLALPARGDGPVCPQLRSTSAAPAEWRLRENPLTETRAHLRAGKRLYRDGAGGCVACHGRRGDGRGVLAGQYEPPPRNFRCADFLRAASAGQIFWIIRNGSAGTAMASHRELSDEQIWQLVMYLQQFSK